MATWKKVIVSGSAANLASLQVDNLLNGVVTGSANGTLGIQAINGTGNIVATTNATNLVHSGSFSGSFKGDGSALSGVAASFPATEKTNLVTGDKFFIQNSVGATSEFVTYGNLLTDLAGANLVTESNDSLTLASTITGLTSISATGFTGSFSGSLIGTASYANNADLLDGLNSTIFATTGSNTFRANQIISGTLDVIPAGAASTELSVTATGVNIGNLVGDIHLVTGSLRVNGSITGSLLGTASFATIAQTANTASFVTSSNVFGPNGANSILSSSYALTASFAQNGAVSNNLTFGTGLSGSSSTFNGSAAVTVAISGSAALTTNLIPKWTGTGLANSNITDTGTQVQIGAGASSGVTIAAGGINVTGASTFQNSLTVTGDLSVAGTASFTNTDNLNVRDKFILINSGSSVLADSGWITQYNAAGSGSAFYLEAGAANDHGPYGRFAVAFDVVGTSTSLTPSEYVVTAKINQASNPSAVPPTWGTGSNGSGNMWITNTGDIFIYA
jgi:hypothetical protein